MPTSSEVAKKMQPKQTAPSTFDHTRFWCFCKDVDIDLTT